MSKIALTPNAAGTGVFTIASPATNTNRTLTLPDEAGTVLTSASSLASANLTGSVPSSAMPAGSVLQVVQGSYATIVAINTGTYTFTGLTATITPKFNNSKILVQIEQQGCKANSIQTGDINLRLQRNSTDVYKFALGYFYGGVSTEFRAGISGCYLDSPATTSATVYRTMFAANDGGTCSVQNDNANTVSTITLMEIAG